MQKSDGITKNIAIWLLWEENSHAMYEIRSDAFFEDFQLLNVLSCWNYYICKERARDYVIKESGKVLTDIEKAALQKFAFEMRRGPGDAWGHLITSNKIERSILAKHPLWNPIFLVIGEALKICKKRIEIIKNNRKQQHQENLQFFRENVPETQSASVTVREFLNMSQTTFTAQLCLLLPLEQISYSAWAYGVDRIILVPPLTDQRDHIRLTLLHEYCHLLFKNDFQYTEKIEAFLGKLSLAHKNKFTLWGEECGLNAAAVTEEFFVSSLFPEGLLGKLMFPNGRGLETSYQTSSFEQLRQAVARRMENGIKQRWHKMITIDQYWKVFFDELEIFLHEKP